MPHALTKRQKEVLQFIRDYVAHEESSPRLDEIANHFNIKPPTAHKYLKALQQKGYLYFGRTSSSGFFIRLIERAGSAETVVEIAVAGLFDSRGEVIDFPQELGHFATLVLGAQPENLFALAASEDLPQANINAHDFIIFDMGKEPQPGDICIITVGERMFLIQVNSRSLFRDTHDLVMAEHYPIPAELMPKDRGHVLHWYPLAWDEESNGFFLEVFKEQNIPIAPMPPELVLGTALRLVRALAS